MIDPISNEMLAEMLAEPQITNRLRSVIRAALETQEQDNKPSPTIRPEVKSEYEILKRLAAGDEIGFSQDGDDAFFTKGDRAFVGRVIISMRSKGYLKRISLDDENYRGLSERDVISDAGLAALETQEGGE